MSIETLNGIENSPSCEKSEMIDVASLPVAEEETPVTTPVQNEEELQGLQSQLAQIADSHEESQLPNPEEIGLELLKRDDFGFYLEIPDTYRERINQHQEEFTPVFESVREAYVKHDEWKYYNPEKPFVYSPHTTAIMSTEILPELMNETEKLFPKEAGTDGMRSILWEESDIEGILNKLLAFESYRLERVMAPRARDYISEQFKDENVIKVKELCTGAGITTALMYEALSETGKDIEFHTADNSLQSVMCAATLLTLRDIPTRIVLDRKSQEKEFKGVTIYFESALESIDKEGKYHFVFSDNGINYFNEEDHYEVVEKMVDRMMPGALFQDCTLDPNMQVDLSTISMFGQLLSRKNEVKEGNDIYKIKVDDGKNYITKLFSASSIMQYELLNVLRREKGIETFWKYLMGAKKAGEITKTLAPKIAQDIRKTKAKIKELVGIDSFEYPSYEEQSLSLTRFIEFTLPEENDME